MVIVKKGAANAKRELPLRFTERDRHGGDASGAAETDAYLAEWRKADPVQRQRRSRKQKSRRRRTNSTRQYDRERLVALAKAGGKEMDRYPADLDNG